MTPPRPRLNRPGLVAFALATVVVAALSLLDLGLAITWRSWIMGGLAVVFAGFGVLLGFETYTMTGAAPPITWQERWTHLRHPLVWPILTLLLGLVEGLLSGHFWWSSCPPVPP
jgi:hypothetical protein